jgi:hypothetical protein
MANLPSTWADMRAAINSAMLFALAKAQRGEI